MKRLWTFVLMFVIASALLAGISYVAYEERFVLSDLTVVADEERFVLSDLTVKDKKTGLIWTRDANIAGKGMSWDDAFSFIEKLNKQEYSGYTDWRLSSKEELITLIDYAKGKGYKRDFHQVLNKVGFRNVQADFYWSSPLAAYDPTYAGIVSMDSGSVAAANNYVTLYFWPVRAGQ